MGADTISIPKVVDPGVKKNFVDGFNEKPMQIDKVMFIGKQESETDELQDYTGLSRFNRVNQSQNYDKDEPIQAYGVNLTAVKFGKEMDVTEEMRRFAKTNLIWDGAKMLGRAARRTVEFEGAELYNRSTDATFTSYSDGKPLGSTQHPSADGGAAMSNASASGIVFNETNLEVGILAMEEQLDNRHQIVDIFANQLVIPPALRKEALIITKSDQRSGTADNDLNVYNSMQTFYGTIETVVWHYLRSSASSNGSNTRWFLRDKDQSEKNVIWQWEEKPVVMRDESVGFDRDVVTYKGRYFASKGWRDPRGFWVSNGDALPYTD